MPSENNPKIVDRTCEGCNKKFESPEDTKCTSGHKCEFHYCPKCNERGWDYHGN